MKVKLAAIQSKLGDMNSAERVADEAVKLGAEFLLFPEYFSYNELDISIGKETIRFLKTFSKDRDVVVCGNIIIDDNGYKNRAFLIDSGDIIGWQDKIHPTRTERALGIKCGEKLDVFEIDGIKVSILVCADILYPELCRVAALKGAEIVLNPVVSFKHSELPGTEYRYCLYFTRSFDNCYAIVKAGGFGYTFTGNEAVGRSLIATFDGVLARSRNEYSEEAVVAEIDMDRIEECRKVNYSLVDRNVKAYLDLLNLE